MVALLTAHFQPAVSVTLERLRFNKRDQRVGESVPDYVAALRSLAQTCAFDTWLEPLLWGRFICGLRLEGLQRRLLAEPDLTWERAVKLARAAEAAKQQSAEPHTSSVGASSVHSAEPSENRGPAQSGGVLSARDATKGHASRATSARHGGGQAPCWRCSEVHDLRTCPHVSSTCYFCGNKGHIQRACRKKIGSRCGATRLRVFLAPAAKPWSEPPCCSCSRLNLW